MKWSWHLQYDTASISKCTERGCMDLKVNLKERKKHKVPTCLTWKWNLNIYLKIYAVGSPFSKIYICALTRTHSWWLGQFRLIWKMWSMVEFIFCLCVCVCVCVYVCVCVIQVSAMSYLFVIPQECTSWVNMPRRRSGTFRRRRRPSTLLRPGDSSTSKATRGPATWLVMSSQRSFWIIIINSSQIL